jgi:hypothetical protein
VAPATRRSDGSWLAVRQAPGIVISDSFDQPFSAAPILVSEVATRCSSPLPSLCCRDFSRAQQFRATIDLPCSMRLQCGHAAGTPIAAPRCGVTAERAQIGVRSRDESAEPFSQLSLEKAPIRIARWGLTWAVSSISSDSSSSSCSFCPCSDCAEQDATENDEEQSCPMF